MLHDADGVGEALEEADEVPPRRGDGERPGELVGIGRRQAPVAAFGRQFDEGGRTKPPVEVVMQQDLRRADDLVGGWSLVSHGQGVSDRPGPAVGLCRAAVEHAGASGPGVERLARGWSGDPRQDQRRSRRRRLGDLEGADEHLASPGDLIGALTVEFEDRLTGDHRFAGFLRQITPADGLTGSSLRARPAPSRQDATPTARASRRER